jgi:hypothetical protein
MFRLIKLAMLGLFGYAIYEFFRGMLQDTQLGNRMSEAFGQMTGGGGQGQQQGEFARGSGDTGRGMNISGPGEGQRESTLEPDGGSVSHRVGRGVTM